MAKRNKKFPYDYNFYKLSFDDGSSCIRMIERDVGNYYDDEIGQEHRLWNREQLRFGSKSKARQLVFIEKATWVDFTRQIDELNKKD